MDKADQLSKREPSGHPRLCSLTYYYYLTLIILLDINLLFSHYEVVTSIAI